MTIGERIREARTAKGLTQEQLAEQVHVTKQAVYKYETGIVTNIPLDKLESIAACLGVALRHRVADNRVRCHPNAGQDHQGRKADF